jgi:NTP pyrophosphatase (non-canonical NTP hydrolase)
MKIRNYSRFTELRTSVTSGLPSIQTEFDSYQRSEFAERSPEFFCLELNGEAGELANIEKKRWKGKSIPDDRFADEVADVFIALMNYANARGVDLASAVSTKLEVIEKKRIELLTNGEEY